MTKTKTHWLEPNGLLIPHAQWKNLKSATPDAWGLRKFENAMFSVTLQAIDRIHSDGTVPPEHWMRFSVTTLNIMEYDFEGRRYGEVQRVVDPDASGEYRTLKEAETAYQLFLARYTDSAFNADTGKFEERGNVFDPDKPKVAETSSKATVEDFGSW